MVERRGTKALELWCKKMTEGYPGVKVENMTTSWRDGLAFCAIIHHFRPELIDFSKLNKDDVFYNNDLAFTVAEKYLGIPALLEPEDMVEYDVPDRLSILTYLSQFYRTFVASQGSSPARIVPKRPANSSDRGGSTSPASTSPPTKMALRSSGVPRREPCAKCGNPVYIAERLTVGKLLYHRTCFRCARCNSQLTLANYYETETPNQFCCETCPDEEKPAAGAIAITSSKSDDKSMLSRSLSDEEKSAGLNRLLVADPDEYSANFESALEESLFKPSAELGSSEYSKARSQFLSANFVDATSDSESAPPELPKTKPPDIAVTKSATPPNARRDINLSKNSSSESTYYTPLNSRLDAKTKNASASVSVSASETKRTNLNLRASPIDSRKSINASDSKKREVTKERSLDNVRKDDNTSTTATPSLVKNRMKMFEKSPDDQEEIRTEQIVERKPHPDSLKIGENLKRPLADPTIVSPEKRIPRDKQESAVKSPRTPTYESTKSIPKKPDTVEKTISVTPRSARTESTKRNENVGLKGPRSEIRPSNLSLKFPNTTKNRFTPENTGTKSSPGTYAKVTTSEEIPDEPGKSPREIAQAQAQSLNFLLRKQIALKEGKITPKSLINQAKADPIENQSSPNVENVPAIKAPKPITTDELAKSLLSSSSSRRSIDEKKSMKSFPLRKTESASEKISWTKPFVVSKYQQKSFDLDAKPKMSPEKYEPVAAYRIKKQQSMEEIPKSKLESPTKIFLSKNFKDGRKENLYQKPFQSTYGCKSVERLGFSSNLNDEARKKTFLDYTSPYRRSSFDSPLRFGSYTALDLDKYKSDKSRFGMYKSDTELNNILNRKPDWSISSPMRSIENLYRSNSEESIRCKVEKAPSELIRVQQTRPSSVSALKNKFECISVVESRPSTTTIATRLEKDSNAAIAPSESIDDPNRSISEMSRPEESQHGELLRDGHLTGSEILEISDDKDDDDDDDSVEAAIVVELTEDSSPECAKSDAAITISDDSVIEISDSSSFNQTTAVSDKLEEKQPAEHTEYYPQDLNPFGEDDEDDDMKETNKKVKDSLNPFDEDDDDEDEENREVPKPTPAVRKKIIVPLLDLHDGDTPESLKSVHVERISINPFDEDDEDEGVYEEENRMRSSAGTGPPKKVISAPRISLNPFWSDVDEDEPEDEDDELRPKPVPRPRKLRNAVPATAIATPEPKPRNQSLGAVTFGSNSSLSSGQSGGQSVRKRKPAPRPPIIVTEPKNESPNESSLTSSPSTSVSHSPRLPAKSRKTKKAPLPPTSTPQSKNSIPIESETTDVSPILHPPTTDTVTPEEEESPNLEEWSNEKNEKDKANENRRSQIFNAPNLILPPGNEYQEYIPNKSTYGKWKRKKGPAPSRPVPERRMIKALPISEFRKELELIELQKQGLEKQGVRLEQIIRDRCENPAEEESYDEDSVPIDAEDLILQLFEVVNEKNELSRREAELMYLQRQQKLEEEHAEVEYQIRCLMMQPEVNKTDSDKAKEEELIQRLVDIVERRNEIIECLEMDRLREAEEDDSISTSLNSYASRRDELMAASLTSLRSDTEQRSEGTLSKKKEKSKKTKKEKKKKKSDVVDADKDVDESESSTTSSTKEKKKKKFALF